jgi:hypothetical protein
VSHRLYIGNKMTEVPYFNTPWFDMAERELLKIPTVIEVFNPAEHDRQMGLNPMLCPHGSKEEATKAGALSLRSVLGADWAWIARFSTGMIVGPDWTRSPGAKSEVACHHALGLPVWAYDVFLRNWNEARLWSPELMVSPLVPMIGEKPPLTLEEPDDGGLFCDCHG